MQVAGRSNPEGAMKVKVGLVSAKARSGAQSSPAHRRPVSVSTLDEAEHEHTRCDPKDGELCLSRTKPEETLVEVRSDSDVQIDRLT